MFRSPATALLAVLVLVPAAIPAEKAPAQKPLGTWTRALGEGKITFTFDAETLRAELVGEGDQALTIHAPYGLTADGTVFGIITKVESKGGASGPEKGDLFSFQVKVEKGELIISDLKGTRESDDARRIVQGEYKKAKKQ
jgi:hypothetical protein